VQRPCKDTGVAARWTPTQAGLVTLVAMCVIGIAVAVLAAPSDQAYSAARARRHGSYAGIAAALAGAAAYVFQARRGKR
jgi:hypothetical protein